MNNPITIVLLLSDYLNLACRGIDERACVDQELATAIRLADPDETLSHIEPLPDNPNLFWVYPVRAWRTSVDRLNKQRAYSESQRQARLIQDEEDRKIQEAQKAELNKWSDFMEKIYLAFPKTTARLGKKNIEELTKAALAGDAPDWLDKLKSKELC